MNEVTEGAVLVTRRDAVAWITLNRPDALNAINIEIQARLPAAIREADADPAIRVLVIQGAGPRSFCAGADIKEFTAVDEPLARRQSRMRDHWIDALDQCQKPLIAAIHGFCLGGGLEIALACDIRVAAGDAQFAFPETGLGVIPAAGGTQRAVRMLGWAQALDLILTGRRFGAEEAKILGLVTRVVAPDALQPAAEELALALAAKPPLALQFAKEAIRKGGELDYAAGRRLETDLLTHLLNTSDRLEAAQAFREKRPPRFSGR